jgi:hypothetical protein
MYALAGASTYDKLSIIISLFVAMWSKMKFILRIKKSTQSFLARGSLHIRTTAVFAIGMV